MLRNELTTQSIVIKLSTNAVICQPNKMMAKEDCLTLAKEIMSGSIVYKSKKFYISLDNGKVYRHATRLEPLTKLKLIYCLLAEKIVPDNAILHMLPKIKLVISHCESILPLMKKNAMLFTSPKTPVKLFAHSENIPGRRSSFKIKKRNQIDGLQSDILSLQTSLIVLGMSIFNSDDNDFEGKNILFLETLEQVKTNLDQLLFGIEPPVMVNIPGTCFEDVETSSQSDETKSSPSFSSTQEINNSSRTSSASPPPIEEEPEGSSCCSCFRL